MENAVVLFSKTKLVNTLNLWTLFLLWF